MQSFKSLYILVLLLVLFIGVSDALSVTITLTPNFDRNTEPEGPNPNNIYNYKFFTFNLSITGLEQNEYYDITATLDSTEYKGTMANYGGQTDKDLKFSGDDYVDDSNGSKLLVWNYGGISTLT